MEYARHSAADLLGSKHERQTAQAILWAVATSAGAGTS
jgi:hypothetical protein